MSKNKFRGIAITTHKDRHGERVTKEFLENQVAVFRKEKQDIWGYWNHLTTLPPNTIVTDEEVEQRDDGEYQLVVEGEMFDAEYFESLFQTDVVIPEVTRRDVFKTMQHLQSSDLGELQIHYDPRNFDPAEIDPIIDSINELIPTKRGLYIRKAEIPQPVIFVLLTFATGFIARFGKVTADKVLEKASSFFEEFNNRFSQLIGKSITTERPDVIISVPIQNSDVIIEGAVEESDIETLKKVWEKLPELYCWAEKIIRTNRKGYFAQLKFLFNPETEEWEINYILTLAKNRVILGPRYIDSSHPLHKRWNEERENYQLDNKNLGISLGFIPTKYE